MMSPRLRRKPTSKDLAIAAAAGVLLFAVLPALFWLAWPPSYLPTYSHVWTVSGTNKEFGEPFGIAVKGSSIYVSDGQNDRIWRIDGDKATVFADGLDTPSGIAFDQNGNLLVADTGSHTIRSVAASGEVSLVAGLPGRSGFVDGDAATAQFHGPVGIAVGGDGKIYAADTYNDKIRVIEKGKVSTLAGGTQGFADGIGEASKFDTPTGLAIRGDKLLVADTGNRRIRIVVPDGRVWTLAGTGDEDLEDGILSQASFVQPTAIAVDTNGFIFVADGNAIRRIGGNAIPAVTTISSKSHGLSDGKTGAAKFNRPSGLAIDPAGDLIVTDSENRLVRRFSAKENGIKITNDQVARLHEKPEDFRNAAAARWPFDPPSAKRDIAGTLGEIRGLMTPEASDVWFHNGLDIAGAYGETARFIRDEKVLRPIAAENFGTLRELLRMPTLGYIHIRLGRDAISNPFGSDRFLFQLDDNGKPTGVRVVRGTKFRAGDAIGTLNSMNHIHLVAGRSGSEMNALDALILPGIADSRPPVIEKVTLFDQNWIPVETVPPNPRIKLTEKTRIVVRAYDQMDGNADRRRLGVYRLGYQILGAVKSPISELKWTIGFDRMPPNAAVGLTYANGSHSGATGETVFNYIVTNSVGGDAFREGFIDPAELNPGDYTLRVFAADYFGNVSSKDIEIEVIK